jgi:transcription antitermination factor NusG
LDTGRVLNDGRNCPDHLRHSPRRSKKGGRVIILRSRPCAEFKVRDKLTLDYKIGAYVPVEFSKRRFGKGKEIVRRAPVVRGYVFADIGPADWHVLTQIPEVAGVVFVHGRPASLTPSQMDSIELLSRPLERANASGWSPGDRVRVRRGAFAELDAVVSEIRKGSVIATVELLGKLHTVKLPENAVEAA